jgi:hypothetical protein
MHRVIQTMQFNYTIGHEILEDTYPNEIIRRDLTRNLAVLFPDIYDEVEKAYNEYIPKTEGLNDNLTI